jgi:uncharacterized membrane protein
LAFIWWMTLVGNLAFAPLLLQVGQVPPVGWLIILVSAALELGYYGAVVVAYQAGDLSLAYPLSRGSAPLFLSLWGIILLAEQPSPLGLIGIALIAAGLYTVNLPRLGDWSAPLAALKTAGPRWAVFGGLCISAYTALDKVGVAHVPPLLYIYLVFVVTWLLATPPVLRLGGWGALREEWAAGWGRIALAGIVTLLAYSVVLWVVRNGTPAIYAGAVRESSVVLAALVGAVGLREGKLLPRLLGAGLVAGGVALIALTG